MAKIVKKASSGENISHVLENVQSGIGEHFENVHKKVGEHIENARSEITEHPIAYVALAAGAGLLAGYLIKYMNRDECRCD